MADPHRRYDDRQNDFNSRGRSPPGWRPYSPQRWGSSSPVRYRRSPSPDTAGRYPARSQSPRRWRSPSRYRNKSSSPPPRGEFSSRRLRSRSPPSNYPIETPEQRRRRLLAEKVMSLETYHRLLQDSKSPYAKTSGIMATPIPVPLAPNENCGDYQQKFEFWLAQRNVTLASLRNDVKRERSYRYGYAQWRVQKIYGKPTPANSRTTTAHSRQRSRSRSPAWSRKRDDQERDQYSSSRPCSPERKLSRSRGCQSYSSTASTRGSSRFYDVRRVVSRRCDGNDGEKGRESEACCKNCDRKWANLNRQLKQLERIVFRLDLPREGAFDGTSVSPYEIDGEARGGSSPTFIDLTDDIEMEATQCETKEDNESPDKSTDAPSRRVEITPTDSDVNHEGPSLAGDLDELATQPLDGEESKTLPDLMLLVTAYNQINDQVMMKRNEEIKVAAEMALIIDEDKTNSAKRLAEIWDVIHKEKDKRDAAIVAIIVHTRDKNQKELEQELQKVAASDADSEQDALHEKCAGIAAKLADKDNELARLQKQLQSLSSLPISTAESDTVLGKREAQELSSKIGLERASKVSLETERQKLFTRLMKSSRQIRAMVSKELASKI